MQIPVMVIGIDTKNEYIDKNGINVMPKAIIIPPTMNLVFILPTNQI